MGPDPSGRVSMSADLNIAAFAFHRQEQTGDGGLPAVALVHSPAQFLLKAWLLRCRVFAPSMP